MATTKSTPKQQLADRHDLIRVHGARENNLKDVGYEDMRWITIGPAGRPDMNIVLTPPAADPGITEDERRIIAEMMAKGTYASIMLATTDLDALFERVQASGADVMQEPTDQPWGSRDCAFRDPAGNTIRIQELP